MSEGEQYNQLHITSEGGLKLLVNRKVQSEIAIFKSIFRASVGIFSQMKMFIPVSEPAKHKH